MKRKGAKMITEVRKIAGAAVRTLLIAFVGLMALGTLIVHSSVLLALTILALLGSRRLFPSSNLFYLDRFFSWLIRIFKGTKADLPRKLEAVRADIAASAENAVRQAQENEKWRKSEKERMRREALAQQAFVDSLRFKCGHEPIAARFSAKSAWGFEEGQTVVVACSETELHFGDIKSRRDVTVALSDICRLSISGSGRTTTSAGIVGGGVGLEGAAEGILAASILNALTTRQQMDTRLEIGVRDKEALIDVLSLDPKSLRSVLSSAFVEFGKRTPAIATAPEDTTHSLAGELERLGKMKTDGLLTDEEFAMAKARLLSS